jgi:hypothetical protein
MPERFCGERYGRLMSWQRTVAVKSLKRELINDDRLVWKQWSHRAGRHLGIGQECSAFQVFGAPKRNRHLWSCHGRTHTHSAHSREGCSIEHVFVRWNKTAGAAATGCIGSDCCLGILAGGRDRTTLQTA